MYEKQWKISVIVTVIALLTGCFQPTPQTYDNVTPEALSPKGQAFLFDRNAWEVMNIVSSKITGESYTPTVSINVPASFVTAVKNRIAQAVVQQPRLQTRPVWIASFSQLVKSADIYKVTPELVGIFEYGIEYQPNKVSWGIKAIINLNTWQIIQWQANTALTPGYVPLRDRLGLTPDQRRESRVVMFGTNQYSLTTGQRNLAVLGDDLNSTVIYNENGSVARVISNADGSVSLQETGTWQ
jgi:hypothetical protein